MTNTELRIKVAEAMGWTEIEPPIPSISYGWHGIPPACNDFRSGMELPRFESDLQACAELRASLTEEERERFTNALIDELNEDGPFAWDWYWKLLNATAEQICIAYLKAKGIE